MSPLWVASRSPERAPARQRWGGERRWRGRIVVHCASLLMRWGVFPAWVQIPPPPQNIFKLISKSKVNFHFMNNNFRSFFYQSVKDSFVSAIILFAVIYYIMNMIGVFFFEGTIIFFDPRKTWFSFFLYLIFWLIFCGIKALLSLKRIDSKNKNLKVEDKN